MTHVPEFRPLSFLFPFSLAVSLLAYDRSGISVCALPSQLPPKHDRQHSCKSHLRKQADGEAAENFSKHYPYTHKLFSLYWNCCTL